MTTTGVSAKAGAVVLVCAGPGLNYMERWSHLNGMTVKGLESSNNKSSRAARKLNED
jgi:hypothetical protein